MSSVDQWKRELLLHRIRELNDAKMRAFSRGGIYHGSPEGVRELIALAIHQLQDDQLPDAERTCRVAELLIIRERRAFVANHAP
jgi:hypothetical protein